MSPGCRKPLNLDEDHKNEVPSQK